MTMTCRVGKMIIKATYILCICIFSLFLNFSQQALCLLFLCVFNKIQVFFKQLQSVQYYVILILAQILLYLKLESSVTTIAAYSLGKTFPTEHRTSTAGVRHAYDNKFTIMFYLIFRWKKCNILSQCIPSMYKYPIPYWFIILNTFPLNCE